MVMMMMMMMRRRRRILNTQAVSTIWRLHLKDIKFHVHHHYHHHSSLRTHHQASASSSSLWSLSATSSSTSSTHHHLSSSIIITTAFPIQFSHDHASWGSFVTYRFKTVWPYFQETECEDLIQSWSNPSREPAERWILLGLWFVVVPFSSSNRKQNRLDILTTWLVFLCNCNFKLPAFCSTFDWILLMSLP